MRRARRHSRRGGFTLLEVLLAISLVLVLMSALFAFLFDMLNSRERARTYSSRQRAANTLIERLEADLFCAVVGDRRSGAGVTGSETEIGVLTRGVPVHLAGRGRNASTVLGDLERVEYRFDERSGELEARRVSADGSGRTAPRFLPIGGPIYKVRFRFHDGADWRASYDSLGSGRLPTAVEVAIWFTPWPGEEPLEADEPDAGLEGEGLMAERMTFDMSGGFDESAFAEASDLETFDEPPPDRIRVIIVPDSATDDSTDGAGGSL